MLEYYPNLIEEAIEFKVESRRILASRKGLIYAVSAQDESMEHLNETYRIIKESENDMAYCCRENQTLQQRKEEKSRQLVTPFVDGPELSSTLARGKR